MQENMQLQTVKTEQELDLVENQEVALEIIGNTSITVLDNINKSMELVKGIFIHHDMTEDEKDFFIDMVNSYKGVRPIPVGEKVGKWLVCIGCILNVVEKERTVVDHQTGERSDFTQRYVIPLFKLQQKNDDDEHIILAGGGNSAKEYCEQMIAMGRAGDWIKPKEIMFSQEERGKDENNNPRRLLRLRVRELKAKA